MYKFDSLVLDLSVRLVPSMENLKIKWVLLFFSTYTKYFHEKKKDQMSCPLE